MKDHLTWLLPMLFYQTDPYFNWKKEDRLVEFEEKILLGNSKEIHVTSSGWRATNNSAVMRYARFQSSVMDIATLLILPTANPEQFPIFVFECVIIMDKVHVLVIDTEHTVPLNKSLQSSGIPKIFNTYSTLFKKTIPEKSTWFNQVASPYVIHCESQTEQLFLIEHATIDYIKQLGEDYYSHSTPCTFKDHPEIKTYKEHHISHAPARKIVAQEEQDWLDEFLKNNHFRII